MALTTRFEAALALAAFLHADQVRKGTGIPYIAHLLSVAGIALDYGADEDEAIAALLHDAVEDQGGMETLGRIRSRFGSGVAEIVLACSDTTETPKPPWGDRKKAYIAHIATASSSARLVSAADKLHNARSILADFDALEAEGWKRFTGGRDGTLWYYRALVGAFRSAHDGPDEASRVRSEALIDELDRVVAAIEERACVRGVALRSCDE